MGAISTSRRTISRLLCTLVVSAPAACGGGEQSAPPALPTSGEPVAHVHGLGIDPANRSLLIATHDGLFRAADRETQARRVGTSTQDTMGFTVIGPRRYLGSGHPGVEEDGPPLLGLIESRDAGRSWASVSLSGQVDFHVLRAAGDAVYGFDSGSGRVLVYRGRGRSWGVAKPIGAILDLLVDPQDERRLLAATPNGLQESRDAGATWRRRSGRVGLLARASSSTLMLVEDDGRTSRSRDGGRTWRSAGSLGASPTALAAGRGALYAALESGAVMQSRDGGRSWRPRVAPPS